MSTPDGLFGYCREHLHLAHTDLMEVAGGHCVVQMEEMSKDG